MMFKSFMFQVFKGKIGTSKYTISRTRACCLQILVLQFHPKGYCNLCNDMLMYCSYTVFTINIKKYMYFKVNYILMLQKLYSNIIKKSRTSICFQSISKILLNKYHM